MRAAGATYFNYVGKPLSYILATPEQPDDADNPLVRAFGNEGSTDDVARFAERFGVAVTDAYGSTEGGATVQRTPDTPPGALGRAPEGTVVLDPATGAECPPARFDDRGRLLNAEEAIGELVSKAGGAGFEGYWRNGEAETARLREGWYWTGDLAYRDDAGFFYFAGRDHDWLRVDGENFASAPIERILQRHPDIVLASVYAVPDPVVGDQVMAAVQLRPGVDALDGEELRGFLAAQGDLGTKWAPRFVRMSGELPATATNKVLKRSLRAERWNCAEPVLWQPDKGGAYRCSMTETEAAGSKKRWATGRSEPGAVSRAVFSGQRTASLSDRRRAPARWSARRCPAVTTTCSTLGHLVDRGAAHQPGALGDPVHAVQVGLAELAAVSVDGERPAELETPVPHEVLGLALGAEAELLQLVEHVGGEVVVEDGRLHVVGAEPRGLPQLAGHDRHLGQPEQVVAVVAGHHVLAGAGALRRGADDDRRVVAGRGHARVRSPPGPVPRRSPGSSRAGAAARR